MKNAVKQGSPGAHDLHTLTTAAKRDSFIVSSLFRKPYRWPGISASALFRFAAHGLQAEYKLPHRSLSLPGGGHADDPLCIFWKAVNRFPIQPKKGIIHKNHFFQLQNMRETSKITLPYLVF